MKNIFEQLFNVINEIRKISLLNYYYYDNDYVHVNVSNFDINSQK